MVDLVQVPTNAGRLLLQAGGFRLAPFMAAGDFAKFCTERGYRITRSRLQRLERLQLFLPVFRVREAGRNHRTVSLPLASTSPFRRGRLIDTASRQPYEVPDEDDRTSEAYYSPFQIASLTFVLSQFTATVNLEGFLDGGDADGNDWANKGEQLRDGMVHGAERARAHQFRPAVDLLCQFISDRYYPKVRGNQRTLQVREGGYAVDHWHERNMSNWKWRDYSRTWNPKAAEKAFGLTPANLKHAYEALAGLQSQDDPLARWHQLVKFVSVRERDRLKGHALGALTMREGALMLRYLHKELYGEDLRDPNEIYGTVITHIPELKVRQDPLRYLEYVVNRYELNPRPKLTLFLEGRSEELVVQQIFEKYFSGYPGTHGIEILVLGGVDTATGAKEDRFRAILRLVDYLHYHQTISFLILDDERNARKLKAEAHQAVSTLHDQRLATRPDYVQLWSVSFEFDNFSNTEIAAALSAISPAAFAVRDIAACRSAKMPAEALVALCRQRTGGKPDKLALAAELAKALFSPKARRKISARPIVKIMERVVALAARNPFPTMQEIWEHNQNSSYLGTPKGKRSPGRKQRAKAK